MKIKVADVEIDCGQSTDSLVTKLQTLVEPMREKVLDVLTNDQDSLKHYFQDGDDITRLRFVKKEYELYEVKVLSSFSPTNFDALYEVDQNGSDVLDTQYKTWIDLLKNLNQFISKHDVVAIRNLREEGLMVKYKPEILKIIIEQKLKTADLSENLKNALLRLNAYVQQQVPSLREICVDTIERNGLFAHKTSEAPYDLEQLPEELQSTISKNKPS
ncbi:TPA: hypothetical protein ACTUXY_003335 [Legionella pneumophila]